MTEEQSFLFLRAWQELEAAVHNRKHGFRTAALATCHDGTPEARTVVLRAAERTPRTLRFHTDLRSQKMGVIHTGVPAAWLFYSFPLKLQVRATGTCQIHTSDELCDQAWAETQLLSRRCYLATHPPGSPIDHSTGGFPEHVIDREPTEEESEAGRQNFAAVTTTVNSLDVYSLAFAGHTRCYFQFDQGQWHADWRIP